MGEFFQERCTGYLIFSSSRSFNILVGQVYSTRQCTDGLDTGGFLSKNYFHRVSEFYSKYSTLKLARITSNIKFKVT